MNYDQAERKRVKDKIRAVGAMEFDPDKLREFMRGAGIRTLTPIANYLGTSTSAICNWMNRRAQPSMPHLAGLADLFGEAMLAFMRPKGRNR